MLLQLETTNQVFMSINAYNSLYHTTLYLVSEMACNEKVIMCGFKPLQVFNRLVIINSLVRFFIFNTCVFATATISCITVQLSLLFCGYNNLEIMLYLSLTVVQKLQRPLPSTHIKIQTREDIMMKFNRS